jgi:hypothetical protein
MRAKAVFFTISEDGFICVPILLIGINPFAALAGGAVFGVIHLGRFTYLECIAKAVIYSLACLWVLPYGLLTLVAGHFTSDVIVLLLLKMIKRKLAEQAAASRRQL